MSDELSVTQISARSRLRALTNFAAVSAGALCIATEYSSCADAAPLTATQGQYYAAILAVVLPTALHQALNALPTGGPSTPTLSDWKENLVAIGDDVAQNTLAQFLDQDAIYGNLFSKMLTADNRNALRMIGELIWQAGKAAHQTAGAAGGIWTGQPPHPKGQNLLNLIQSIESYQPSPE